MLLLLVVEVVGEGLLLVLQKQLLGARALVGLVVERLLALLEALLRLWKAVAVAFREGSDRRGWGQRLLSSWRSLFRILSVAHGLWIIIAKCVTVSSSRVAIRSPLLFSLRALDIFLVALSFGGVCACFTLLVVADVCQVRLQPLRHIYGQGPEAQLPELRLLLHVLHRRRHLPVVRRWLSFFRERGQRNAWRTEQKTERWLAVRGSEDTA